MILACDQVISSTSAVGKKTVELSWWSDCGAKCHLNTMRVNGRAGGSMALMVVKASGGRVT